MNLHTNTFDLVLMRLKRKANDYLQFHLTHQFICLFPSLPVSFVVFRHQWVCQRDSQLQSPCLLQQYQRVLLLRMQARIHWEWPRMQRYMQRLTFVHIKLRTAVTMTRNAKHIANRAWIHKYTKSDNSYDKREEYFVGWYHEIWAGKRAEWLITLKTQVTLVTWRAIS